MIDQLHKLEFSIGPLCVRHVLERSGQLLDCHILGSDSIIRRAATEGIQDRLISFAPDRAMSNLYIEIK